MCKCFYFVRQPSNNYTTVVERIENNCRMNTYLNPTVVYIQTLIIQLSLIPHVLAIAEGFVL
ncbi:hypothetical protein GGQ57_003733 [Parabacteroides faecis]|uniref:Uncharacterized protein n=1 Tax=Parabacteroides faecis TaxID=1217282 RepID=A0ABR6KQY7_9BACT|nr:hypothetical protein [Parabacteroides faecis]